MVEAKLATRDATVKPPGLTPTERLDQQEWDHYASRRKLNGQVSHLISKLVQPREFRPSSRSVTLTRHADGFEAKVDQGTRKQARTFDPPKRGKVSSFSDRSRSRLYRYFAELRLELMPAAHHITLTYHTEEIDGAKAKRDLNAYAKRLERFDPAGGALIWRLEYQKRGTPHFHLLYFSDKRRPAFARWWHEVTGETSTAHRYRGCKVRALDSVKVIRHYLGKYVAKPESDELPRFDGNHWGKRGMRNKPDWKAPDGEIDIDAPDFVLLRRLARKLLRSHVNRLRATGKPYRGLQRRLRSLSTGRLQGFYLFGDLAAAFEDVVKGTVGPMRPDDSARASPSPAPF